MSDQHGEGARMCRKRYDGVKGKGVRGWGTVVLLPRALREEEEDSSSNSEGLQGLGGSSSGN